MARLSTVLQSTVFQRVLASTGLFVVLTLLAIWGIGLAVLSQIARSETAEIDAWLAYGHELYLMDGTEGLTAEIALEDDEPLWSNDFIWWILEDEQTLVVLRAPDGDIIAGYPGLFADEDLQEVTLDHPEIDMPLMARRISLFDDSTLTVGRFIPERSGEIWGFLIAGSLALVVITLPLSLITGYFLSRGVFRRLDGLAQTAGTVAAGQMTARAPVTGTGDEFDRLAAGVNQMLDRIEALTRNVEAVSVGVAHDLKTPLSNIRGRLELIDRDREKPDAVAEHVAVADARLSGLLRVFDAMLRLGEIEAGHRRAGFSTVDLSHLANEMADGYGAAFEEADKRLETSIAPGLLVEGDGDLLAQAISNLLDNALEHSRDAALVRFTARTEGADAVIAVGDDGPGIAPPLRAQVFERFFRGDASRATAGNGLGLALVKAIADLHHADLILLDDQPGAVFVLRLRLAKDGGQAYKFV
ncbi:MAG: HAMP domain-containing sensor histidine kinase [Pseudomonadota bacterium]